MNMIYIVVSGYWDEYSIEKVFFNENKANEFCDEMNKKYHGLYYRIEPWEISDNKENK